MIEQSLQISILSNTHNILTFNPFHIDIHYIRFVYQVIFLWTMNFLGIILYHPHDCGHYCLLWFSIVGVVVSVECNRFAVRFMHFHEIETMFNVTRASESLQCPQYTISVLCMKGGFVYLLIHTLWLSVFV